MMWFDDLNLFTLSLKQFGSDGLLKKSSFSLISDRNTFMSGSKGKWLWLDSVYSFIIAKFNWFTEMEAKLGFFLSVLLLVLSPFSSSPFIKKLTHRGLLKLNQLVDGTD